MELSAGSAQVSVTLWCATDAAVSAVGAEGTGDSAGTAQGVTSSAATKAPPATTRKRGILRLSRVQLHGEDSLKDTPNTD